MVRGKRSSITCVLVNQTLFEILVNECEMSKFNDYLTGAGICSQVSQCVNARMHMQATMSYYCRAGVGFWESQMLRLAVDR